MRRSVIIFTLGWPAAWGRRAGGPYSTLPPDSLAASRWGRWHSSLGRLVSLPSQGAGLGLICSNFLDPPGRSALGRQAGTSKYTSMGRSVSGHQPSSPSSPTPPRATETVCGPLSGFPHLPGSVLGENWFVSGAGKTAARLVCLPSLFIGNACKEIHV